MRHWIDLLNAPPNDAAQPTLLQELADNSNRQLNHVVQVLSKSLGTLMRVGGPTRVYDIARRQKGAIFAVGNSMSGIGLGWTDNSGVCSIYYWQTLNVLVPPDYQIDLPPAVNFDVMVPQVIDALRSQTDGKIAVAESLQEAPQPRPEQQPDMTKIGPTSDPTQDPKFQNMLTLARAKEIHNLAGEQRIFIIGHNPANDTYFSVPGAAAYAARMERMLSSTLPHSDEGRPSMEEQYENLSETVALVASGRAANIKSVLVVGAPSSGKSHVVEQTIEKELKLKLNTDYVISTGMLTRYELYKLLIERLTSLIVLDDCDEIVKDGDAVNMLKGALNTGRTREVAYRAHGTINIGILSREDQAEYVTRLSRVLRGLPEATDAEFFSHYVHVKSARNTMPNGKATPDEVRVDPDDDEDYSHLFDDPTLDKNNKYVPDEQAKQIFAYVTNHLPNVIDWKGRMIFISNLTQEQWPDAIRSRSNIVEMNFTDEEMLNYIDKIKNSVHGNISPEQKTEVMDYVRSLWTTGRMNRAINFRFIQACFDYRLVPNWQRRIAMLAQKRQA